MLVSLAAWFVGTHYLHVYSEVINWDEFALLARADRSLRLGEVAGGGRPGLVSIFLMPLVRGCVDSVATTVNARLVWQFITLAYLVGVYFLVRRWFVHSGRPSEGRIEGLLGAALLAFLPAFVTWSVQVRTDQAALAAAVWGGVLLIGTGRWSAVLAGALFGTSMLCTQKGIYAVSLGTLLYCTATASRYASAPAAGRSELAATSIRLVLVAFGAGTVLGAYLYLVPAAAHLATQAGFESGFQAMQWVRERQGYRIYTVHADRLVVHWALFAALLAGSVYAILRRDARMAMTIGTSWFVLLLGAAVIVFHGASYQYFMVTAGLFPAVGLAIASGPALRATGRLMWPVTAILLTSLAMQSALEVFEMLDDTQAEQRETIRLANALSVNGKRGYSADGALFWSRDPDPFPIMFSRDIWFHFTDKPEAVESFISEFRERPVAFIVESYRLQQFPEEIRAFWHEQYVWYARSLFVAGFRLNDERQSRSIDVLVPGRSRWMPDGEFAASPIFVDSNEVQPFGETYLELGRHELQVGALPVKGRLVLADLPVIELGDYPAFYHRQHRERLGGYR